MSEDPIIILQDPTRGVLIERADLRRWRVAVPEEAVIRTGVEYVALAEVPGVRHTLDTGKGVLTVTVDPASFVREDRALYDLGLPKVGPTPFGAFLNYDAGIERTPFSTESSGYLQLGLFGGASVLTSDWGLIEGDNQRLNTTFTHDSPEHIATLRVGDFSAANSSFAAGLPIGGLQWSTNFETRPGIVPIPLQRMRGEVAVPSTVEIYVNGVPTYRTEVQPGPFTITDIPVVTGSGDVQMVITDATGRRSIIRNPFYASPTVLRAGLAEYSYEVGRQRVPDASGLGLEYADWVASGTHRWGVTDWFTAELRAEWTDANSLFGAAAAFLVPGGGALRVGVAGNRLDNGDHGTLGLLGYENVIGRFSVAFEAQHAWPNFTQVGGLPADPVHSRDLSRLALGWNSATIGSIALAVEHERNLSNPVTNAATLTYSRGFAGFLTLSVSASHDFESGADSGFASLSIPFGGATSASISGSTQRSNSETSYDTVASVQRSLGTGPSWGYRLGAAQGGDSTAEFAAQGDIGSVRIGADRVGHDMAEHAAFGGGLVLAGGSLFPSRRLGDGFAVVRIPDTPGIGVYADNNFIGRTNDDGELLVPSLIPYRETRITLDAAALPIDTQLATDRIAVTPRYRAAAFAQFASQRLHGYTARLARHDGRPVPAGARLRVGVNATEQPLGTDGLVYLTLEPGTYRLEARWADTTCVARVTIDPSDEPQPDLGILTCKEAAP